MCIVAIFLHPCLLQKTFCSKCKISGYHQRYQIEIPNKISLEKAAASYSSMFFSTLPPESIMMLSYKAKKTRILFLLFSEYRTVEVYEGEKRKSIVILDYSNNKGGVDTADEML